MIALTINELIERLEDYRDEIGGDTEVRMMTQSNWPFENTIFGLCSGAEINALNDEEEEEDDVEEDDVEKVGVLYLVEGDQLGYGSKRAWLPRFAI